MTYVLAIKADSQWQYTKLEIIITTALNELHSSDSLNEHES